jgi:hypothetical protein
LRLEYREHAIVGPQLSSSVSDINIKPDMKKSAAAVMITPERTREEFRYQQPCASASGKISSVDHR